MREAIDRSVRRLAGAGCTTPWLDARVLLSHATGWDEAQLVVRGGDPLAPEHERAFESALARRERHEPVAYIVGAKEFFSLSFGVDPRVLVPRPETELVVEVALAELRARLAYARGGELCVVDVGTGSGAIAISIAHALARDAAGARFQVIGLDRSSEALAVARDNAARLLGRGIAVELVRGDLLDAVKPGTVDLIVSNPPYLSPAELEGASLDVKFEPRFSLDGGTADGLGVVEKLLAGARRALRAGGTVVSEIGSEQGDGASELARRAGLGAVRIERDLAGLARAVVARKELAGG